MSSLPAAHLTQVVRAITQGRVVPFFGAGVNLCTASLANEKDWVPGTRHLPSAAQLSQHLARYYGYPFENVSDLLAVSQYVAVASGTGPLYDELRNVFDAEFPCTRVHNFFATVSNVLAEKGRRPRPRHLLIVTTNYDDLMERAFDALDQEYDVVTYVADGEHRGKFRHVPPGGAPLVIERPNEYDRLALEERPVILKIHGAVDRRQRDFDSYVITEDHYIDYLTRTDIANLLPVALAAKLRQSHLLFLGYSLRDWNLRVILHRISEDQKLKYKSWAVQLGPSEIERMFWKEREVEIFDATLEEYISEIETRLCEVPDVDGQPS